MIKPSDLLKEDKETDNEVSSEYKVFELDWAIPPKVSDLKNDLREANEAHNAHVSKVDTWLDNLNVTGSAKVQAPKKGKGAVRSTFVPKLIRKRAEWRYSSLTEPFLSTPDLFRASPVTFEDKKSAEQTQLLLNKQFNTDINKVKFIDEYVRTAVDEGTVILRTGWEYEESIEERHVPEFQYIRVPPEKAEEFMAQLEAAERNGMLDEELEESLRETTRTGQPVLAKKTGTTYVEEYLKVVKNRPTVEVCNYRNVIVDPTAEGDVDKANFIIYEFETSISDLKKDGRYKNLDKLNVQSLTRSSSDMMNLSEQEIMNIENKNFNFSDDARKIFKAYEYWGFWDVDGTGVTKPIVATFVGDTMIRLEENPFPDKKLPFVIVHYLPVRKSNYGEPDGVLLEDNQKVAGAVIRGMIDLLGKSAAGQKGYAKNSLDLVNKRKFEAGLDYEYEPTVTNPEQVFFIHKFPEIPASAQYMLDLQNEDADSLTGVKAYSSGISGNALGSTATGVRSALDAASKRELGILRRLAQGLVEVGRKFISMNAVFLSEEEIVRVTNDEFVPIRKDDLAGNIDLALSISTAEADNQKAEELAFLLQTSAQAMPEDFSRLILAEIVKLRKMPDLAKRIEEYQPQPDPMQEIAMQEAKLRIELLKSEIVDKQTQAEWNAERAKTERAKQANLYSDTDLKDLDYLSKETGVDHVRELQKEALKQSMSNKGEAGRPATGENTDDSTSTYNGISQV